MSDQVSSTAPSFHYQPKYIYITLKDPFVDTAKNSSNYNVDMYCLKEKFYLHVLIALWFKDIYLIIILKILSIGAKNNHQIVMVLLFERKEHF